MRLERGWRHAQKRWPWEFEDFEKESVESWYWTMEADSWVLCHWVGSWVFRISTGSDELRSKTPRNVPNVGSGVYIVWWQKTFKNCVFLLVSKNRSQKLINRSYLNNSVRLHLYMYRWIDIIKLYNNRSNAMIGRCSLNSQHGGRSLRSANVDCYYSRGTNNNASERRKKMK